MFTLSFSLDQTCSSRISPVFSSNFLPFISCPFFSFLISLLLIQTDSLVTLDEQWFRSFFFFFLLSSLFLFIFFLLLSLFLFFSLEFISTKREREEEDGFCLISEWQEKKEQEGTKLNEGERERREQKRRERKREKARARKREKEEERKYFWDTIGFFFFPNFLSPWNECPGHWNRHQVERESFLLSFPLSMFLSQSISFYPGHHRSLVIVVIIIIGLDSLVDSIIFFPSFFVL